MDKEQEKEKPDEKETGETKTPPVQKEIRPEASLQSEPRPKDSTRIRSMFW